MRKDLQQIIIYNYFIDFDWIAEMAKVAENETDFSSNVKFIT